MVSPVLASGVTTTDSVKVPNWILSDATLEVVFNERATQQIDEFQINRVSKINSLFDLGQIYTHDFDGNGR